MNHSKYIAVSLLSALAMGVTGASAAEKIKPVKRAL